MKIALVYDRLNKIGGAERVLTAFSEIYPDADWYTSVWDPKNAQFSKKWHVVSSWMSHIPIVRSHHEWIPFLMPFIFESYDFSQYDCVISIGSAECKGIITPPKTLHLHYCLTPTRYLYSHAEEYLNTKAFAVVGKYMRMWDQVAATRPDEMISISQHVKRRVKKYYKRETEVIYPPVDVQKYKTQMPLEQVKQYGDYYLVVSRLVPYKKVDLIVRAFNINKKTLVIIGTGSQKNALRKLAHKNIHFLHSVSDQELPAYYQNCQAFIQANEEDFGIAMVESLAAGKPVVAYKVGGASEIITEETGVLYNELSVAGLNRAITECEQKTFNNSACQKRADTFNRDTWKKTIKQRIMIAWNKHKKIYEL